MTLSCLLTLGEILCVLPTKLWTLLFFFIFPLLLYLFPLVTSGSNSGVGTQCLAGGCIFLSRLLILSIFSFVNFCLSSFSVHAHTLFKS